MRLDLECELHCTVYLGYAHQCSCNSVSHRHSAIQQMMDVKWSANNYPLYVDDGGRPSSSWSSISPPLSFFFFVICILSLTHTVFFSWEEKSIITLSGRIVKFYYFTVLVLTPVYPPQSLIMLSIISQNTINPSDPV